LEVPLNKGPVYEHEANAMGFLFIIQHLPRHCPLIRDWPSHAGHTDTTLKASEALLIEKEQ